MQESRDMQARLESLSITKDQRPSAATTSRRGWGKLIVLVFVIALAAVGYSARDRIVPVARNLAAGTGNRPGVELMTVTVSAPPTPGPVLTATGKIVSDHTVSVATKVSGQIVSLHFEQGDTVQKGQLLATIEDVLYRAQRDEAAAQLARSKANLEYQKVNFERVSHLIKRDHAEKIEFANARRALDEARAQVDAAKASLAFAQKTLNDCKVVAPIGGVILQRNVEVGDFVAAEGGIGANANARFAVIADMSKLRVEVDISELDITRVHKDMPCVIIPDAYKDRKYTGHVMWLDPGANYSKATVQVKVRIEGADEFLRVDGSAQVAFMTPDPQTPPSELPTGIWIPKSAVRQDAQGKQFVLTAETGRLRKVIVATGKERGNRILIRSGLQKGQKIARNNQETLHDGMQFSRPTNQP